MPLVCTLLILTVDEVLRYKNHRENRRSLVIFNRKVHILAPQEVL